MSLKLPILGVMDPFFKGHGDWYRVPNPYFPITHGQSMGLPEGDDLNYQGMFDGIDRPQVLGGVPQAYGKPLTHWVP